MLMCSLHSYVGRTLSAGDEAKDFCKAPVDSKFRVCIKVALIKTHLQIKFFKALTPEQTGETSQLLVFRRRRSQLSTLAMMCHFVSRPPAGFFFIFHTSLQTVRSHTTKQNRDASVRTLFDPREMNESDI